MFSTSLDILNLVLALCIVVLTFFLCWAIYYLVASVRRIHQITKRVEAGIAKAEQLLDIAKEKLRNSSAYFMILAEIAKKAMEFVKDRQAKKKSSKAEKK